MEEIIWKDIPGYEGILQASNTGQIKRLSRRVEFIRKGGDVNYQVDDVILKQYIYQGYCRIEYRIDKIKKRHRVHRLIALAFHPNPLNKETVNHIDCNKENNRPENLEWASFEENRVHAKKNGLLKGVPGNKWNNKLTDEQIREIRDCNNKTQAELGMQYNIPQTCICMIKNRKTYKHVQ